MFLPFQFLCCNLIIQRNFWIIWRIAVELCDWKIFEHTSQEHKSRVSKSRTQVGCGKDTGCPTKSQGWPFSLCVSVMLWTSGGTHKGNTNGVYLEASLDIQRSCWVLKRSWEHWALRQKQGKQKWWARGPREQRAMEEAAVSFSRGKRSFLSSYIV